ncbi:hypothetical protein J6590_084617 [Homalodisca vitripennis]|nr:hypothetical protein J6590_084617 [Homalodisca vitripennis]
MGQSDNQQAMERILKLIVGSVKGGVLPPMSTPPRPSRRSVAVILSVLSIQYRSQYGYTKTPSHIPIVYSKIDWLQMTPKRVVRMHGVVQIVLGNSPDAFLF